MAGLIRRVFLRQMFPLRSSTEHPEDAFEDTAVILARAATGLNAGDWGDKRRDDAPLLVGEMHGRALGPRSCPYCTASILRLVLVYLILARFNKSNAVVIFRVGELKFPN